MNALCLLSGRCLTSLSPPPAPGLPRGTQAGAAETAAEPQDAVRRGFTDTGGQSCTVSAVAPADAQRHISAGRLCVM